MRVGRFVVYAVSVSTLSATEVQDVALNALCPIDGADVELHSRQREQVRAALRSGVTWDEIGEAAGLNGEQARVLFTASTRAALDAVAAANSDLDEDEAIELAVAEVKAVRGARPQR